MARKNEQNTPPANGEDLLQQAKQTTSEVVDKVQQQAGSRLDRGKDRAAKELQKVAGAVRELGEGLGGQDQGPIAHYAAQYGKKAADGLERLTNYLRENDTRALVSEIEKFGRRQPAILGGAFLLGQAGRFFKSSMPAATESNRNLRRGLPHRHISRHTYKLRLRHCDRGGTMQPRMNEARRIEERPLGELFSDLVTETTTLVRNEVALAKVEIQSNQSRQEYRLAGCRRRDCIRRSSGNRRGGHSALSAGDAGVDRCRDRRTDSRRRGLVDDQQGHHGTSANGSETAGNRRVAQGGRAMDQRSDQLNEESWIEDRSPTMPRVEESLVDESVEFRDTDSETERIKADIEETRAEMGHTLNEIQERLSPEHLMDQVKETVREATIGKVERVMEKVNEKISNVTEPAMEMMGNAGEKLKDAGSSMSNIVRQNPIPCALIGLGLGMFIVNRVRNADSRTTRSRSYDMDSETGYGWPHLVMREWPASSPPV